MSDCPHMYDHVTIFEGVVTCQDCGKRWVEAQAPGQLHGFVGKMWLELENAADAVGPVPDLVERNLRIWSREAWALIAPEAEAPDNGEPNYWVDESVGGPGYVIGGTREGHIVARYASFEEADTACRELNESLGNR